MLLLLSFLLSVASPAPAQRTDLGATAAWRVQNSNGSVACACSVPGMIHTDLLSAGLIPEPYLQFNDALQKWIVEDDWTYTGSFASPAAALASPLVDLVFDGLATVARVTLNDALVLRTDNQFRTWRAPVRPLLRAAGVNNTLTVAIASSVRWAAAADAAYDMRSHNITSCPNAIEQGFCYRQFIRQNPASFSWDWNPPFPSIGIFRRVSLLARSGAALLGATVVTTPAGGAAPLTPGAAAAWTLNITLWLDAPAAQAGMARVALAALGLNVSARVALAPGLQPVALAVPVPAALAWWPATFAAAGGAPTLYNATVAFESDAGDVAAQALRVGFRTVALVQDSLPGGTSFFFRVNGHKVYMKGSNFVPIDAFESRVTLANLTAHFAAYRDAGFNIIRHWGGAVYQRDEFFDLADEHGILVFMEFSFANANYPTDDAFLATVAAEVRDQALRLQAHPSILLWSANNEIARGLSRQYYGNRSDPRFPLYVEDYRRLHFDTILANLAAIDDVALFAGGGGARPALSSSPSQGNNSRAWPVPFEPPGSSGTSNLSGLVDGLWRGDFHGYLYAIDCWNASEYPRTRFSTEFGLQSWPSLETMARFSGATPAQLRNFSDPYWVQRNRHPAGNAQLAFFVEQHFPAPAQSDVRAWMWMTQVTQAYCIRQQAEHYRRLTSECDAAQPTGAGCNGGALFWQAADAWPGPTWSSLEYGARRKMLHYYAAHFFAPFLASAFLDGDMARGAVYAINEDARSARAGSVTLRIVSLTGGVVATLPPLPFAVGAAASARVARFTTADLLAAGGGACATAAACFIIWETAAEPAPAPPRAPPGGPPFLLLASVARGSLRDPKLAVVGVEAGAAPGAFRVRWSATAVALFVWFETPLRGAFSDNGFAHVPGVAPGELWWTAAPDGAMPAAAELAASLRVWSLFDVDAGRDLTSRWPA